MNERLRAMTIAPFDTLIISNVLEHIEHRPQFLRTVQDALAPGRATS